MEDANLTVTFYSRNPIAYLFLKTRKPTLLNIWMPVKRKVLVLLTFVSKQAINVCLFWHSQSHTPFIILFLCLFCKM
jgi:hypothetical protein